MFTSAKWIWNPHVHGNNCTAAFRKTFDLDALPTQAKLLASAHNFMKLFVNGRQISGLYSPASSVYPKTKLYLSYDLAPYLRQGKNVISALVLYLGSDGQNYVNGKPGFIFEAVLGSGEDAQRICSDETCLSTACTGFRQNTPCREKRRLTAMMHYDTNTPDYHAPEFDDSGWENSCLSLCQLDEFRLEEQTIPEGKIKRELPAALIFENSERKVYDLGEVMTGFVRATVCGKQGQTLRMRYAENLEGERLSYEDALVNHYRHADPADLSVEHSVSNDKSEYFCDEFVLNGQRQVLEENMTYKAFRYIEITGFDPDTEITAVTGCKASTAMESPGTFSCSDDAVNHLVQACKETQHNNIQGLLVDCPHREQSQYLGDSLMQSHMLIYNFTQTHEMLRKVLQDFADAQLSDGYFPFVTPTNWYMTEFQHVIPEYDLDYTEIMHQVYFYFGDTDVISRFYGTAKKMMLYYLNRRNSRGLILKREGWFHITDWPHSRVMQDAKVLSGQNIMAVLSLQRLAEFARMLKLPEDAGFWKASHEELKQAVRANLFDPEKQLYRDCLGSDAHGMSVNALALKAGLAEGAEARILEEFLSRNLDSSVICSYDLLKELGSAGKIQKMYDLITDPNFRWGKMMARGFKTIWEDFYEIHSLSHAWNCYPLRLLQEFVLGIRNEAPGFSRVSITPFFPKGMDRISGKVLTGERGWISLTGQRSKGKASFTVTVQMEAPEEIRFCYGGISRLLPAGVSQIEINED